MARNSGDDIIAAITGIAMLIILIFLASTLFSSKQLSISIDPSSVLFGLILILIALVIAVIVTIFSKASEFLGLGGAV